MKLAVKLVSTLEKVFTDEEPRAYPADIPLTGLRNETQSFQIAYTLPVPLEGDRALVFVEPRCPVPFQVRRVEQVPVRLACFADTDDNYLRKTPGLYPDPLRALPLHLPLRALHGQWSALWVDIEPDQDTSPGEYVFSLRFVGEDGIELGHQTVPFTVLPESLPPQRLIHARWLHADALAVHYGVEMFGEEHFAILKNYISLAVRRGVNMMLTPIHTPPLDTRVGGERPTAQLVDIEVADGGYRFGFDKLRRFIRLCMDCGVTYFEMAHLFTQWGARHAPKIVARVDGQMTQLFGWQTDATGPAYAAFLRAYLPALIDELRSLGVAERCWFHISDEPNRQQQADYLRAKALVAPLLSGFPILDALSDFSFYESGTVPHPVPAINDVAPFLDARVPDLWTYYCVAQHRDVSNCFIAMPAARTRMLGMQLFQYNFRGFLQWAYNFWFSQYADYPVNPWHSADADGFTPAGDAWQVYPGPDGQPVESLRLMLFFHAMQDLRALDALAQRIGRPAVLNIITKGLPHPPTLTDYPRDAEYLLRLRHRVNELLHQQGA